jgi:fucose permease
VDDELLCSPTTATAESPEYDLIIVAHNDQSGQITSLLSENAPTPTVTFVEYPLLSRMAVVWLGTVGLGLSMASIFPTTLSLAERRMTITGQVTGWFFVGASAGGMALPWLIGQLFESVGPRVTVFAILIDLIVAVGVFVILMLYSRPVMDER